MSFSARLFVLSRSLVMGVCCAIAAGCSNQGVSPPLNGENVQWKGASRINGQNRYFGDGSKLGPLLYISAGSAYDYYALAYSTHAQHSLVCSDINYETASSAVQQIGVDKAGVLWVPTQNSNGNPSGNDVIYSYLPNCGGAGLSLFAPHNGGARNIAFDNRDGTNYVLMTTKFGGLPFVSAYPRGRATEARRLKDPTSNTGAWGVGVDSLGNVYAVYGNSSSNQVAIVEYKKGHGSGSLLNMQLTGWPFGTLIFDKRRNMIVPNIKESVVDIYAPPYTGAPTSITLTAPTAQCSLNRRETMLACLHLLPGSEPGGYADVYSYPSGAYKYSVYTPASYSPGWGVAFSPSAP
jgi:hypothetical protein